MRRDLFALNPRFPRSDAVKKSTAESRSFWQATQNDGPPHWSLARQNFSRITKRTQFSGLKSISLLFKYILGGPQSPLITLIWRRSCFIVAANTHGAGGSMELPGLLFHLLRGLTSVGTSRLLPII